MSFARNAAKHTTTQIYRLSYTLAIAHRIINTISFEAYARANTGHLLKVRYTAIKLVVTDIVLGIMLAVLKCSRIK